MSESRPLITSEQDHLRALVKKLNQSIAGDLGPFLGKSLVLSTPEYLETLSALGPAEVTPAAFAEGGDFQGQIVSVLSVSGAKALAGSLLQWDAEGFEAQLASPIVDEETQDAAAEIFNLVNGSINKAMPKYLDCKAALTKADTRVFEIEDAAALAKSSEVEEDLVLIQVSGEVTGVGAVNWLWGFTQNLAHDLVKQSITLFTEEKIAAELNAKDTLAAVEVVSPVTSGPIKVLAVDDTRMMRKLLGNYLREPGVYEFTEADSGSVALTLLRSKPFDVVILDIMMPKMSGFEVCQRLRALDHENKDAKVIMCSTKNLKEDILMALKSGANDYIIKPFSKALLRDKIKKHIES